MTKPEPSAAADRKPKPGYFELEGVCDLFRKLESDLVKLQQSPADSYLCFNFFVTAEHMPEWLYGHHPAAGRKKPPKSWTKEARVKTLRAKYVLLQVCSHLANGAKHFEATSPLHKSVATTGKRVRLRVQPDLAANRSSIPFRYVNEFTVSLNPTEANELGAKTIAADDLAQRILDFWRKKLDDTFGSGAV